MQYSYILKDISRNTKLPRKMLKEAYKTINEAMEMLECLAKPSTQWQLYTRYGSIYGKGFTEAICPHSAGHHNGVHGCHWVSEEDKRSCCEYCPKEIWDKVSKD